MTRYIRWDYDKHEAVEFERSGECNRCGDCCKALIRFTASLHPHLGPNNTYDDEDIRDGGKYVDGRGIWNEVVNEKGERRYFRFEEIDPTNREHACSELRVEGAEHSCNIHFDKNLLCRAWPLAPEHVTPFEQCSYTFTEIARWNFEPCTESNSS